jgi:3-phenylpropionate/trans-cinnamate dioxygenase ferredoxin subunit
MTEFQFAAKKAEIPDPGKLLVEIDDQLVVLIHAGGSFYALDDVCTHDGGPLGEGGLNAAEKTIACPRHGAKFDLISGEPRSMPATQKTRVHTVEVRGEDLFVKIAEE